jgi:hypothetical protein
MAWLSDPEALTALARSDRGRRCLPARRKPHRIVN